MKKIHEEKPSVRQEAGLKLTNLEGNTVVSGKRSLPVPGFL